MTDGQRTDHLAGPATRQELDLANEFPTAQPTRRGHITITATMLVARAVRLHSRLTSKRRKPTAQREADRHDLTDTDTAIPTVNATPLIIRRDAGNHRPPKRRRRQATLSLAIRVREQIEMKLWIADEQLGRPLSFLVTTLAALATAVVMDIITPQLPNPLLATLTWALTVVAVPSCVLAAGLWFIDAKPHRSRRHNRRTGKR